MNKFNSISIHIIVFIVVQFNSFNFLAQNSKTEITFSVNFANTTLDLDTYYALGSSDSIQITSVKFYLSEFELWQDNRMVWKEENKFRLVDLSDKKTMIFNLDHVRPIKFNSIHFNLGIDSITNVSGALGGDLDPTKGMYWTWQSGYINFKLEGNSNVCKTRNNEFVFHLGGYQSPYLGLQQVKLKVNNENKITLLLNIKEVIDSIELGKQNHIMSPSIDAVMLAEKVAKAIKVN